METLLIELLRSLVSGLLMGMVFALVALGLTIIFGVMDIVNFAHGEFLMFGMYATLLVSPLMGVDPLLALPICGLVGAGLGLCCYFGVVRFLLRGPMVAQLLGTFGLMLTLRNLALLFMGSEPRLVKSGFLVGRSLVLGLGVVLESTKLAAAALSIVSFLFVWWLIRRTKTGMALTAASLDKEGAHYMGISTERMNGLAWALGGASVAIAGGLLVNFWPVEPNVGLLFTMIAFAAGIIIGLIVYIPPVWDALASFSGVESVTLHGFKYTFVYTIYFLIMVLSPRGLFGWKQ